MYPTLIEKKGCGCKGDGQAHGELERVKYFQRQLLTAEDMVTEQNYFREKARRHNRYLHGWGVVCGLAVTAAPVDVAPWRVAIASGYALDQHGNEIILEGPFYLDLDRCAAGDQTDPCDPEIYRRVGTEQRPQLFVAIRYAECFAKPVRAMPPGCGCEDTPCEYSRIRDSFELGCVPEPQVPNLPSICTLLQSGAIMPCPPEPTTDWVVLARVNLAASGAGKITDALIHNEVRVRLFSTAPIQEQLINCCCQPRQVSPATVIMSGPNNEDELFEPDPGSVKVTFSKEMNAQTITPSSFTVTRQGQSEPLPGQVKYDAATRTAEFTPDDPFRDGSFNVAVLGTGNSPVIDAEGTALDGDADGEPGGNFAGTFSVTATPK